MVDIRGEIESGEFFSKKESLQKVSEKLAKLNDEALELLKRIENLKEEQKQLEISYKRITEDEMPGLLDEIGISGVALPTGEYIGIDTSIHCSIPKQVEDPAFQWLRDNNHSDLIKNELKIKFGRSEDNMVGEIKTKAHELGLNYEEKATVHSMTLRAFAKEQMKSGVNLPQDLFDVYIRRVVDVKANKKG